jgi:type I restriction enzyme S subunit
MSLEWKIIRLGDSCLKIGSGATPQGGKESYLESGTYSLFRSQNVHNDGFKIGGLVYLNDAQAKKLQNVAVEIDDVLLNITGDSVARVCLAPAHFLPARVNQHVAIIRPKAEFFDSRFIRYFLASPVQQNLMLGLASTGGTRNALTKSMIEDFKIPCPSLSIQKQISDILSALDDRITLLRETNATLEAIAQALFKSWFVDFDPVHAKAQGTKPEGMDEQTAALFPDRFVESELGMVPLGWEVGTLGNVSTVKGGFAYKGESFCDKGFPVIKIKNIVGDGTVNLIDVQYVSSEIAEKTKRFALQDGDIVIAMTGATIGKTGIIVTNEFIPYLNQRVAKFEENSKGQNNKWFVFVAFQNLFISDQIVNSASGSAQPNISTTGIESVRLVIPKDTKLLSVYNELVSPLFNSWISNHKQTQTLATLRDTLLPRLISGQLRLPDVEA